MAYPSPLPPPPCSALPHLRPPHQAPAVLRRAARAAARVCGAAAAGGAHGPSQCSAGFSLRCAFTRALAPTDRWLPCSGSTQLASLSALIIFTRPPVLASEPLALSPRLLHASLPPLPLLPSPAPLARSMRRDLSASVCRSCMMHAGGGGRSRASRWQRRSAWRRCGREALAQRQACRRAAPPMQQQRQLQRGSRQGAGSSGRARPSRRQRAPPARARRGLQW